MADSTEYPKDEEKFYMPEDVERMVANGEWLGCYDPPVPYGEKRSSAETEES